MNIIISIVTFLIVLFIYLHIYYHIKISNYLEVYDIQNLSKERLEEICDLRQPATFYLDIECFDLLLLENVKKEYGSFDIKIRDTMHNTNSEIYLPYILNKAIVAIKEKRYYSEKNEDFLNETSLLKILKVNDYFLRPLSLMTSNYDYLIGAELSQTPFRYDVCYRNYFVLLEGEAIIKLTPPKNKKYLFTHKDYDNFEFRSPINPWNVQKQYQNNFDKIKCLDISLTKGKVLFIPAYWWYSIQFNSSETVILNFKYKTYMNNITLLPDYFKCFLQKQNIKHVIIDNNSNNNNNSNSNETIEPNINVSNLNINDSDINDILNNMKVGDISSVSSVSPVSPVNDAI
jgi:hypothetical protein